MAESLNDWLAAPEQTPAAGASQPQAKQGESLNDWLAAPEHPTAPPSVAPYVPPDPTALGSELGLSLPTAAAPVDGGPLARIGKATAQGWQFSPPVLTPEARAAVDKYGGILGREVVNPLLDIGGGIIGAGNALAGGIGQSAYEVGAGLGGPQLGRDFYMGQQVLPATEMARVPIRGPDINALTTPEARFVPEHYGERYPGQPVTLQDLTGAIQRADAPPPPPAPVTPPAPPPLNIPAGPVTTAAHAKQIASAYYNEADQVGGVLTPNVTDKFIDNVAATAPQTPAGQAVLGQSPVSALADRLQSLRGQPLSLQAAQEIDEGLGNLIDQQYGPRGMSKDGKQLTDIQQAFRDQIRNAGPDDIIGGSSGFDALGLGRQAWSQAMKLSDLERIQQRASMTDNPATSVRTQIRTMLTNPARVRGYSPEELDALQDAANRGVVGSALHVFGSRLIPLAAGAAGFPSGGFFGSLATAGLAHVGTTGLRNWATNIANNRLAAAQNALGANVPPPPVNPTSGP